MGELTNLLTIKFPLFYFVFENAIEKGYEAKGVFLCGVLGIFWVFILFLFVECDFREMRVLALGLG